MTIEEHSYVFVNENTPLDLNELNNIGAAGYYNN